MFESGPRSHLVAAVQQAGVEASALDRDGTLDALALWQRVAACVEHALLTAAAHFADLHGRGQDHPVAKGRERLVRLGGAGTPVVEEFAALELGAELGMSAERAGGLMADALDLRHRLPDVFAALERGEVEAWRARIVARGTRDLSAALAGQVESEVLPHLASVTTVRLKKFVAEAVIAAAPERAEEDFELPDATAASPWGHPRTV